ncbi:MAG: hypothetical protein ABR599_11650 [Gemmatimonadota bacterium]
MGLLPYLHPLWQAGALALAIWALAMGLRMRGLRRRGTWSARAALVDRHARIGLAFVATLVVGLAAGPLILALARGEPALSSGHAFFAALTLAPLLPGAVLGWRLWRGRARPDDRDLHAFCMGVGLFLGIITGMLGLGLLP